MNIKFKKSKTLPRNGKFVALRNAFPVENKNNLGLVVNVRRDPLGFNYDILEFHDFKIYTHHISTLIPLKSAWKK